MSFKKERIDIEIIEHLETYYKVKIGTIEVWIQESDLEIAKKQVLKDKKFEKAYIGLLKSDIEEMESERKRLYTWNEVENAARSALKDYENGW